MHVCFSRSILASSSQNLIPSFGHSKCTATTGGDVVMSLNIAQVLPFHSMQENGRNDLELRQEQDEWIRPRIVNWLHFYGNLLSRESLPVMEKPGTSDLMSLVTAGLSYAYKNGGFPLCKRDRYGSGFNKVHRKLFGYITSVLCNMMNAYINQATYCITLQCCRLFSAKTLEPFGPEL